MLKRTTLAVGGVAGKQDCVLAEHIGDIYGISLPAGTDI
jgi:hypothetical protein